MSDAGKPFDATEASGGTVGDLLKSAGPLPEAKAIAIIRDCARILQTAWEDAQLTHGGINVEDIRLQPDGVVKLAGLAPGRSGEGSRIGDIRALGDVLCQMLTNEPRLQPGQDMPNLSKKRPDIGPFAGEVIGKMRAEAAWNYSSYGQLVEDLNAVLAGRQPPHTQVKLSLGAASVSLAPTGAEPTTPAHARPQRRPASHWKLWLVRLAGLMILAATAWQTWRYLDRASLMPLPPVPATPPPPIMLAPAEPAPPAAPAQPTFEHIADPVERGRAMAKHLGAARLQAGFGGMVSVLEDGQVRWSYAFRDGKELGDFSEGAHRLQDGSLLLPRAETAFKCPLLGDFTLVVEGQVVEASPHGPLQALAIAWHQGTPCERMFGFTRTSAELCETVAGKRVVVATAPFEWKPGATLRYVITQRGSFCAVKVREGPMVTGTFTQPAEGTLRLVSEDCVSAYGVLEITGSAPAARLSLIAP
jgi:hypothetical protein